MADLLNDADIRIQLAYQQAEQDDGDLEIHHRRFRRNQTLGAGFLQLTVAKHVNYVMAAPLGLSVAKEVNYVVTAPVGISVAKSISYIVTIRQPVSLLWPTPTMRNRLRWPEEVEEPGGLSPLMFRHISLDAIPPPPSPNNQGNFFFL